MAHNWYAIQTHSGSELSVKRTLEDMADRLGDGKIAEVIVPTEDLIEMKNSKEVITERPLYAAYVFAKIDLTTELWHAIQSLPKVGRFIGESKKPSPLPDKDIEHILAKVKTRAKPKPKIVFEQDEIIRIKEGSFANFNGQVEHFDLASGMLKLNVLIFGRNTSVEIPYTQVERVVE